MSSTPPPHPEPRPPAGVAPAAPGLPAGLELVRTTREFGAQDTPAALRSAHRVATGVWGLLRVRSGSVTFVLEAPAGGRELRRELGAGDTQVIEPGVVHHVEPGDDARFVVEFHR